MSNSSDDQIFPLKKGIFYRKPLTVDLSEILYHFLKETDQIPLPYKQQWCRSYNKVGYKLQANNNLTHREIFSPPHFIVDFLILENFQSSNLI